jgi:hypothetical protein
MAITLTANTASDDLISAARAQYVPDIATAYAANSAYVATLISAASAAIRKYTRRNLTQDDYTEYFSGARHAIGDYKAVPQLVLSESPVQSVARVATDPTTVLTITNTSSSVQRATVGTTSTALTLTRVASAVSTSNTLSFATYPTLTLLAAAITAVGNGWAATVTSGYTAHASADLYNPQGAASAKTSGGVELLMFIEDVNDWRCDYDAGIITSACLPAGVDNIRVDYNAGYVTVPEDLQDICAKLVLRMYQGDKVNHTAKSTTLGPYSITYADQVLGMNKDLCMALSAYRDDSKLIGDAQ